MSNGSIVFGDVAYKLICEPGISAMRAESEGNKIKGTTKLLNFACVSMAKNMTGKPAGIPFSPSRPHADGDGLPAGLHQRESLSVARERSTNGDH